MLESGKFLGERYEIVSQIGTGGMADVYKAKDHKLNRFVAVKILKPEFREDTTFIRKFRSEAQAAAGLTHPNIVNVFDVGEDDSMHYIVMELIEGITLKDYINKKGRLSIKEATSIAIQVSMGLEAAHSHGIVHRDVKPQNIMIGTDGKVKVTDFGIARAASSNTISSNVMGSVHYSSPEQVRGGYSDEKSDIYSLGVTLYEMVTGKVPFEGDTTVAIAIKHLQEEMVPPSAYTEDLPYSLEQIINKCTQKSVDRRYQKMEDMIADLKHSLIDPEGDFVKLEAKNESSKTQVITQKDLDEIRHNTGKITVSRPEKDGDDYYGEEDEENEEDDDSDQDEERTSGGLRIVLKTLGLIVGIAALIGIIVFAARKTGLIGGDSKDNKPVVTEPVTQQNTEPEQTEPEVAEGMALVPNMLGMTEQEATDLAQASNLGVKFVGEEESQLQAGVVCWQDQPEGIEIPKYSTISYKISKGQRAAETAPMDDLVNSMYSEELKNQYLEKGYGLVIQRRYDDIAEEEVILSTSPAAGQEIKPGDTITIVVSDNDALQEDIPDEVYESNVKPVKEEMSKEDQLAQDPDAWVCNNTLNAPEGYQGGQIRLELTQEAQGEMKTYMIVDGEVVAFPYKLNIKGVAGVPTGNIRVSELVNGVYNELGYYPVKFEAQQ